jgi:hypothetical protein
MQMEANSSIIETNYTQTSINPELLKMLDDKSIGEFHEILEKIILAKNMISPTRRKALDIPKDKKGRIIVDLENLHVLENMEYFIEAANHFRKFKCYTRLYPNSNPNSEYKKFWDEEKRRCIEGYIRESDGEWIPGYYYFYLNYSPILKVEETEDLSDIIDNLDSGIRADRVEDFPDIWDGDYLFFHYIEQSEQEGKHGTVLKTRGRGYSFKGGSMFSRNYFHVDGSKSYAFASETEYLTRDGILTKAWANINFVDNYTPFTQPRDYKDTEMHKRASYKDTDNKTEKGIMSEVIGVTCKNDPQKGRGKRGKLLFFDESGVFPGLLQTWQIARKSVEQGRYVYGFMVTTGTGGTENADFEAAEKFFYHPSGYNIKSLKNIFDKVNGNGTCGLFIPEYLNRQGCYDENGNSDVVKALIEILLQREKVRNNTTDSVTLLQEKAESPITPQEACLKKEGSIFPVLDIKEYLASIYPSLDMFVKSHYVGDLVMDIDGEVKFKMDSSKFPIRSFPIKSDTDKRGAVEIFEMPKKISDEYRYILGVDTIDDDQVKFSVSLGSAIVFDRWTRRIVAEYTGRPDMVNDFYEIVYRLSRFYNAKIMYESNKKGLFGYFANVRRALTMLADTPEFLSNKQVIRQPSTISNASKGINNSGNSENSINPWGRRLQADWMISPAYVENAEENDENAPKLLNLHKIRSIAYLEECRSWSPDINVDRISAMNMVMIYDAELQKYETGVRKEKIKTLADDPFFNRHYRGKRLMGSYPTKKEFKL